ncbi:MAG: hypothetical protein WCL32_13685, partial [Planctomycetota bacterium]
HARMNRIRVERSGDPTGAVGRAKEGLTYFALQEVDVKHFFDVYGRWGHPSPLAEWGSVELSAIARLLLRNARKTTSRFEVGNGKLSCAKKPEFFASRYLMDGNSPCSHTPLKSNSQ